jgi:hypothetical protein
MPVINDKSRIMKQTDKRREKPKQLEEQDNPNSMETITLNVLHSKSGQQKHWLGFQDIVDGFQNKALLIDYWNKPDEFKIDLLQSLTALETKGKIEKKTVDEESYFSDAF